MKSRVVVLSAISALAVSAAQIHEVDDFDGMDTSSDEAVSFWDVSSHPPVTNTVASATIAASGCVDTRRVGVASAAIETFDSRFFTVGSAALAGDLRSDPPRGVYLIVR